MKWKANKAHEEKAKVVTDAKLELAEAKRRIEEETAKVGKLESAMATIEHEAEVARLALTEAQEAFQAHVDANKKPATKTGGEAKPADQQGCGGQAGPQPPAAMDLISCLNAVNTELVATPQQIRDSYLGADVQEMQRLLMRIADASRATAHFRTTNEFIASESKPYYAELVGDPEMPDEIIQTFFGEGLVKDDQIGLKKNGP